jgi:hypothetical protein
MKSQIYEFMNAGTVVEQVGVDPDPNPRIHASD